MAGSQCEVSSTEYSSTGSKLLKINVITGMLANTVPDIFSILNFWYVWRVHIAHLIPFNLAKVWVPLYKIQALKHIVNLYKLNTR